ncbi:hypothetical protein PK98_01075 [Croceibacterium mercuriale]|uniref:Uncharacterized protein n=1 Tax=Croceibacterium mercuriale TaxID=1572751 RepID=A0A0B2BZQ6_9SPHN|nr:hypothetical protein [Croceibacterium mercuriale]KHL25350.1 hypothetical protein PK98_01075 [Croceibacterium mercuriale]
MRFNFYDVVSPAELRTGLLQIVAYLDEYGVDRLSHVQLYCLPWRGGDLLQAVDERGRTAPVVVQHIEGDLWRRLGPGPSSRQASGLAEADSLSARGLGLWSDLSGED